MDGDSSLEDFITTGLLLDVFRPGRYVRRSPRRLAKPAKVALMAAEAAQLD